MSFSIVPAKADSFYPVCPKDVWVEILTFADKHTLAKVLSVCKALKQYAEDKRITDKQHPYEKFARFYLKSLDANEVLKQFKTLSIEHQNFIKTTIWQEGGQQIIRKGDWAEAEMQNRLFGQTVCKTVLLVGKLGYKIPALEAFKAYVNDPKSSSDQVVHALQELDRFFLENLDDKSIMEAIKYEIWDISLRQDKGDIDFGFTYIKKTPHSDVVKTAISNIEDNLFYLIRNTKPAILPFSTIKDCALRKEVQVFIHFYKTHEDPKLILKEFEKLSELAQKGIRYLIWQIGGEQTLHLGDWAKQEMMTNLKGPLVQAALKGLEDNLFRLTRQEAVAKFSKLKLIEFRRLVDDLTIPNEKVLEALTQLKSEEAPGRYIGTCCLYEHVLFEFYVMRASVSRPPESAGELFDWVNWGLMLIENDPHSPVFRAFLKGLTS